MTTKNRALPAKMPRTLTIAIDVPGMFYSTRDEDHFFAWLRSIDGVHAVVGHGRTLQVTVTYPLRWESFRDLVVLMTRYGLDRRCLMPLAERGRSPRFRDPRQFWFEGVFGSADAGAGGA